MAWRTVIEPTRIDAGEGAEREEVTRGQGGDDAADDGHRQGEQHEEGHPPCTEGCLQEEEHEDGDAGDDREQAGLGVLLHHRGASDLGVVFDREGNARESSLDVT